MWHIVVPWTSGRICSTGLDTCYEVKIDVVDLSILSFGR